MENVLMTDIISKTLQGLCMVLMLVLFHGHAMAAKADNIVLDAGHGGYDTGMVVDGIKENDFSLDIVKSLKTALEEKDKKVWLTRKIDQFTPMTERREEANSAMPDLFMSIHLSANEKLAVYTTWYMKSDKNLSIAEYYEISSIQRKYLHESRVLSRTIGRVLARALDVPVEYRRMPLELLGSIGAPAVMVEIPGSDIGNKERITEIIDAIIMAIEEYERGT